MSFEKYDPDGPFVDPVVRCHACQALILRKTIQSVGSCPKCGHRRMGNVLNIESEEIEALKKQGVDPDWFDLFKPISKEDEEGVISV